MHQREIRTWRHGARLIVLVAMFGAQLPSMQDDKTLMLRSNTRVVEVDVSVRDSQGKPVESLLKEDFTLTDNGKPRSFSIFNRSGGMQGPQSVPTRVPLPARVPRPELPPGTFTNIGEPVRPPEGHSTVILLDAINGWAENFLWSRQGVLEMPDKVPADEKIALYVITREGLGTIQDYTTDHARLLDAMKKYAVRGMQPAPPGTEPLGQGMMESPPIVRVGRVKGQEDGGDSAAKSLGARIASMKIDRSQPAMLLKATESVRLSLKALAEKLQSQPGRKSVYWMTEGFPPSQIWGVGQETWEKTISELNDANVQVNAIDSNRLDGPPRYWGYGAIRTMQQLARETGGKAYYSRNDLDGALLEGIADSRDTYTLGFYLAEVDGKYHELKVNVDRPGMALNYRQGYYALDEPKPDTRNMSDLGAVLLNPGDSTGVGIVARLDVKPGRPRNTINVRLQLDPEALSLKKSDAGRSGKVEEMFVEFNAEGREVGRITATSPFDIKPENQAAFEKQGVAMVQSFGLPADAVKLTIIVRDTASGRVGSLTVPLEKATQAGAVK